MAISCHSSHIGHIRAEQRVKAETDGFAMESLVALFGGEFAAIGRSSDYLDGVLAKTAIEIWYPQCLSEGMEEFNPLSHRSQMFGAL